MLEFNISTDQFLKYQKPSIWDVSLHVSYVIVVTIKIPLHIDI